METRILLPDQLASAIASLKEGMPVAIPTETVYGLAAPIANPEAVEKIFAIKGRPSDNPLIVHVSSVAEAAELGENLPEIFFTLARTFWPGPLTLVVKKSALVPPIVSAGLDSVAIRFPSHLVARKIIEQVGPVAAPSANLSGSPSPTKASDVLEDLEGKIAWIVDGGECVIGIESTVISLLQKTPILLRPGSILKEDLEKICGPIEQATETTPICSPE